MMMFTNYEDLAKAAVKYGLSGWYVQDSSDSYLGVLNSADDMWYIGTTPADGTVYPVTVDRIPR